MELEQFLSDHTIVKIGYTVPGHLLTDVIVDNPTELVKLIGDSKYYISGILWWERTPIGHVPQFGTGGVLDPRYPNDFYFAETCLCRSFDKGHSNQDYYDYIRDIYCANPTITLFPSFDIACV